MFRKMTAYQSPFQFGTLATEENFIDRVEDRAMLKQMLASHINVMLISPRRWGKSSLVKKAMGELSAEDKNVRICYIDAFSIGSEAEFYRTFASQVIACASSKMERWIEDAKKFLTGVVPQIVGKRVRDASIYASKKISLKFLFLSDIFLFPPIRQQVPILA